MSTDQGFTMLERGRYRVRETRARADIAAAQALRYRAFIDPAGAGRDADRFDAACTHFLIEPRAGGAAVACFRLMALASGRDIAQSYSAQFYDLEKLSGFAGPMAELGRFCVAPGQGNADILRLAWGAMTAFVDRAGIEMMFGCTSFAGTDARRYREAFALLRARHLAPGRWLPGVRARDVVRFAPRAGPAPPRARARGAMPPLLRSYLAMGGWVGDHAVVDAQMNTLHVFTGLETRAVPRARARALRAVAGQEQGRAGHAASTEI